MALTAKLGAVASELGNIELGLGSAPVINPLRTQTAYRWRNDNGSESTATWQAAEDVNVGVVPTTNVRLRTQVDVTRTVPPSEALKLQYRTVGSTTWQDLEAP